MITRELALNLLDDEHGVNGQAWKVLADVLYDCDFHDIIDAAETIKPGRIGIPAEKAKALWASPPTDDEE